MLVPGCGDRVDTCSPLAGQTWRVRQSVRALQSGAPAASCLSNYPSKTSSGSLKGHRKENPGEGSRTSEGAKDGVPCPGSSTPRVGLPLCPPAGPEPASCPTHPAPFRSQRDPIKSNHTHTSRLLKKPLKLKNFHPRPTPRPQHPGLAIPPGTQDPSVLGAHRFPS